jgi:adenylate cyclase
MHDITVMRLRAMLARGGGDEATCRKLEARYRTTAEELGFENHVAQAEAMR